MDICQTTKHRIVNDKCECCAFFACCLVIWLYEPKFSRHKDVDHGDVGLAFTKDAEQLVVAGAIPGSVLISLVLFASTHGFSKEKKNMQRESGFESTKPERRRTRRGGRHQRRIQRRRRGGVGSRLRT